MTAIVDTGPLLAAANRSDPLHPEIARVLDLERGDLVIPAPVSTEIDYMLGRRIGAQARRTFYRDVAAGRFVIECLQPWDYALVAELDEQYADLGLGLADASIVVLARRFETTRLVTFDTRDFRTVRPLQGGVFTLLPEDENVS